MSDQVVENEPAVVAGDAVIDPPVVEAADPSPVEIPEGWASMHWKHVVALARQIAGNIEISYEDAKRIIGDELVTREAIGSDDGLVAMTKNGDTLRVNPNTVDAHKRAGWMLV
jgi:hypothetical protein